VSRALVAEAVQAPGSRYLNREISNLQFTERVLELAEDTSLPLLERAKFLAITASNLDEFYMVRVAGLKRQQAAGLVQVSADGLTAEEQLTAIAEMAAPLMDRLVSAFTGSVQPALQKHGIRIFRWHELTKERRHELETVFKNQIFPILTPLAVDPGHPFPYISNRSLNLAVWVKEKGSDRRHFARVKVPPLLPRLFAVPRGYVPLEDIIAANLGDLFPGMKILERHVFRVTRDAELEVDDEGSEDLLSALEQELNRRRFSKAVRLEIEEGMPSHLLDMLRRELQLDDGDVFDLPGPLDLTFLMDLYEVDKPELKYPRFKPATHPALLPRDDKPLDIFLVLAQRDVLVQHPYHSFTTSVQAFIEQAAADPNVLAIKQTLYRTSGESPIVDALIEAAEAGKQVVVLVEIKARFDEVANINWARALEKAGCHVVYGLVGLKTHCKLCMIVRQEGGRLQRYVHVGTGNYNPSTAAVYEDFGLLTANEQLGEDVGNLFNYLTGYSRHESYDWLLVAPHEMRQRMCELIDREARHAREGREGKIIFKLNSLVDETIIDHLYDASQAGASIDILARSICALRPGVDGLSENIRVKSILGRFLEHSRIYHFGNAGQPETYTGSADMMHRNLDRRVEVLVRVASKDLQATLAGVLERGLKDNIGSWQLDSQGEWQRTTPVQPDDARDIQKELMAGAGTA
jgi:polyphosphate kinase